MYLPNGNQYEWAFDAPNINWTATHLYDRRSTKFFDVSKRRKVRVADLKRST
jgi:hypothetical protein